MSKNLPKYLVLMLSLVAVLLVVIFKTENKSTIIPLPNGTDKVAFPVTESPFKYQAPTIVKNRSYRLVIVGDSMTKALGPNANKLREYLIEYYPENEFVIYNYGYSSTNIESLPVRLTEKTTYLGTENEAILRQGFELIIIESFGYNPLSYGTLEEGLKKQEAILEESLKLIVKEKPEVAILLMTPIAPDPETFAKGTYDLSPEVRKEWVAERIKYIDNFRNYAIKKNIPLIDVYTASLNNDGSINKTYIAGDYIHPSVKGIDMMAREIADFIAKSEVFPR